MEPLFGPRDQRSERTGNRKEHIAHKESFNRSQRSEKTLRISDFEFQLSYASGSVLLAPCSVLFPSDVWELGARNPVDSWRLGIALR